MSGAEAPLPPPGDHAAGRLAARPGADRQGPWPLPPGLHPLGLPGPRGGLLRVPAGAGHGLLPLLVMLHGATGDAERALRRIEPIADAALIVLPESEGRSWDVIEGGYGPDLARLDTALAAVLAAWPVDPTRLAIAGFSDGASYALSVALMNGDLFTHALCFSPGFAAPMGMAGRARFFLSHGTDDEVLPIDRCSRRLAPQLQRAGYVTRYLEFAGGHALPVEIAHAARDFFLGDAA